MEYIAFIIPFMLISIAIYGIYKLFVYGYKTDNKA